MLSALSLRLIILFFSVALILSYDIWIDLLPKSRKDNHVHLGLAIPKERFSLTDGKSNERNFIPY